MISEANFAVAQVEVEPIELETPKQSFRTSAFRSIRKSNVEREVPVLASVSDELFSVSRSEKILSSALVTRKAGTRSKEDLERRLAQLMKSPPVRALMQAARTLATETNASEGQAIQDILASLGELSEIWDQLLTREGLERLSEPV